MLALPAFSVLALGGSSVVGVRGSSLVGSSLVLLPVRASSRVMPHCL